MEHAAPRFVADKMLGRLARWLRLLGFDVLYGPNFSGRGLFEAARRDGRVVLTRDRRQLRDPERPDLVFVESDLFREQLRQVVEACDLDPFAHLFQRCVECNSDLESVGRDAATGKVPPYVLETQERFLRCRRCRHLYWEATHVTRVHDELRRMGFAPRGE
ncbi:MAG: Mut7-C RNAse domain-containing protein [Candidatus Binatia bacterium]